MVTNTEKIWLQTNMKKVTNSPKDVLQIYRKIMIH